MYPSKCIRHHPSSPVCLPPFNSSSLLSRPSFLSLFLPLLFRPSPSYSLPRPNERGMGWGGGDGKTRGIRDEEKGHI
eukprot:1483252-Pyramimonas_sp.AAC.1